MDYFLNTELTKNPDGYRGSIYMYKDAGPKARTRWIPWDYNEAFGEEISGDFETSKSPSFDVSSSV